MGLGVRVVGVGSWGRVPMGDWSGDQGFGAMAVADPGFTQRGAKPQVGALGYKSTKSSLKLHEIPPPLDSPLDGWGFSTNQLPKLWLLHVIMLSTSSTLRYCVFVTLTLCSMHNQDNLVFRLL